MASRINIEQMEREKLELLAKKKQLAEYLRLAFDAHDPSSRPTPEQSAFLCQDTPYNLYWIICSNRSGKTTTAARELAWWLQEIHPYKKRRTSWRGPLRLALIGKTHQIMTQEIWEAKIRPLLPAGSFEERYVQGNINEVTFRETGNTLIFISHENATQARERIQSFTLHVVVFDEMTSYAPLLSEAMMRVINSDGIFMATFTPLVESEEVVRLVEGTLTSPEMKHRAVRMQFHMKNNPSMKAIYSEAEMQGMIRALCVTEEEFEARWNGRWVRKSNRVFAYNPDRNLLATLPVDYDPKTWEHYALVDPAASGLVGLALATRRPGTVSPWYIPFANYLRGGAFSEILPVIDKTLEPFNVVWRKCDNNPSAFWKESKAQFKAGRISAPWKPVPDKTNTRETTIEQMNQLLMASALVLFPGLHALEKEFSSCVRKETDPSKVANSTRFHLLDCIRYLVRMLPKEILQSTEKNESGLKQQAYANLIRDWNREAKRAARNKRGTWRVVTPKNKSRWI